MSCGAIFSDCYYTFSPESDSEKMFENWSIFDEVIGCTNSVLHFWATVYTLKV